MRDSAADGSEDMEAVKSMIWEWSATYAAVADRSASINSSQNEVYVALTKRRADIDAFKEIFGPDSGASPAERLEYGSLLRETLFTDKRAEVQRARSVAEHISVSPALAARDKALNMSIFPAIVARTALQHIPDISARNRRHLTGIYSDEYEADATVFKYDEKSEDDEVECDRTLLQTRNNGEVSPQTETAVSGQVSCSTLNDPWDSISNEGLLPFVCAARSYCQTPGAGRPPSVCLNLHCTADADGRRRVHDCIADTVYRLIQIKQRDYL
jgi:hypothetical protein